MNHDPSNDNNDDLTNIFEHLTPEDFVTETTSMEDLERTNEGAESFNAFVDEQLRMLRTAYIAAEGSLNPIAIIASPTVQRIFAAEDDESLGQYVARVAREAKRIGAIWTFVSKKTLVASQEAEYDGSPQPDVNDPEEVQEAVATGAMVVGVMWYAERREGDDQHHRIGIMLDEHGRRLGKAIEGSEVQGVPLFAQILG